MAETTGVKVTPPAEDKPPKKSQPPKEPAAKKTPPKPTSKKPRGRPPEMEKQLGDFFMFIGTTVYAFNPKDGEAIMNNSESLAQAWANLAREDKRVKEFIDRMTTGSAWGQVVFVTAALGIQIAANHGAIPSMPAVGAAMFGVEQPQQPSPGPPHPA